MSKPAIVPLTRISVMTRFDDGTVFTYSVEADRDDFTTDTFAEACERLALVVGYDPKQVKEAFRG